MIELKNGDIFGEDVEALVNSVNCVGVMGRGIALQFKNLFPKNFKAYAAACKRGEVKPGRMFVHELAPLANPRYVVNFPTKRHWRGKSRIEDIDAGLIDLVRVIKELNIRSIAIPPLATNLGGLSWSDVRPRIEYALGELEDVAVVLFEPGSGSVDGRPQSLQRRSQYDQESSGAGQPYGPIPARPARSIRDTPGSPQAHVLHAKFW